MRPSFSADLASLTSIKASGLLHRLKQITEKLHSAQLETTDPTEHREVMQELEGFMLEVRARRWESMRKERLLRMRTRHSIRLSNVKNLRCSPGESLSARHTVMRTASETAANCVPRKQAHETASTTAKRP